MVLGDLDFWKRLFFNSVVELPMEELAANWVPSSGVKQVPIIISGVAFKSDVEISQCE